MINKQQIIKHIAWELDSDLNEVFEYIEELENKIEELEEKLEK